MGAGHGVAVWAPNAREVSVIGSFNDGTPNAQVASTWQFGYLEGFILSGQGPLGAHTANAVPCSPLSCRKMRPEFLVDAIVRSFVEKMKVLTCKSALPHAEMLPEVS